MIAFAAGLLLAALTAPPEGPRVALLVGDDVGLPDERPLRSTGADAQRLAAVLRELGGFAPESVRVLENRTAAEVLDALDVVARGPPPSVFLFYYSGHADAGALHAAGTLLPVDLLLHRLKGVPAGLRVAVLDACQSGAAARAKGSRPEAPFEVRAAEEPSSGDILVSSSAADEQSFEGEHGGLFTLHWTAGLRGAADADGDGQVTLGEVYAYAYAQTLRATLAASAGPQHARFRWELAGRRDPVLTRLAGGALLTLEARSDGEYVVFDGRERSVVAELPSRAGESRRVALAPGAYVVRQRGTRALRVARLQLAAGDDRVLAEHQMQEVPLLRLARKGAFGERQLTVGAGAYGSGLGPRGQLRGALGLEWERAEWLPGIALAFAGGSERHRELATRDLLAEVSGSLLYTVRLGGVALRAGPVAGIDWLRQDPRGLETASGVGVSLGLRLRADVPLAQGLGLLAEGDGRALAVRAADAPEGGVHAGRVGVAPLWSFALGLRVAL